MSKIVVCNEEYLNLLRSVTETLGEYSYLVSKYILPIERDTKHN
jgi:hypothetical protein